MLESNASIIILWLGSNGIGDLGATALAGMLESNTSITHLFLIGNDISADLTTAIARAVQSDRTAVVAASKVSRPVEHRRPVGASSARGCRRFGPQPTRLP